MNSTGSVPPSALAPAGAQNASMGEEGRLTQISHMLDVTVWLMIFCIFVFFFIIIVAALCMHWLERRSKGNLRGECLLMPAGPVPGCITVMSANQPHLRLISHYYLEPCCYSSSGRLLTKPRCFSSPNVKCVYDDFIDRKQ